MKYLTIALALFVSSATFASSQQTATVINHTQTNIHIEYLICEGNNCDGSGGGHSFFTDESTHFVVNLKPNQTVRIKYAEEIDHQNGNAIPNGARESWNGEWCKANAGQTISLFPGLIGRTLGMIFCQVD